MSEPRKDDRGKYDMLLIPWAGLKEVVRALMYGRDKYGRDNWIEVLKGENGPQRYQNALLRHVMEDADGCRIDPDSGLLHLAHACASALFLIWWYCVGERTQHGSRSTSGDVRTRDVGTEGSEARCRRTSRSWDSEG